MARYYQRAALLIFLWNGNIDDLVQRVDFAPLTLPRAPGR